MLCSVGIRRWRILMRLLKYLCERDVGQCNEGKVDGEFLFDGKPMYVML